MTRATLFVLLLLGSAELRAQPDSTVARPALLQAVEWLQAKGVTVREAFDGSAKESKPASVLYINDEEGEEDYFSVDLAVKVGEWELFPNHAPQLLLYPVVEWHRADREEKPVGILKGSFKAEFRPVALRLRDSSGAVLAEGWPVAPLLLGSLDLSNDYEAEERKTTAAAFVSLASRIPWAPGSDIRHPDGSLLARYYPYAGYEQYGVSGDAGTDVGVAVARLYAELWPISFIAADGEAYEYLQFVGDASYRQVVTGSFGDEESLSYLSLSANLFPDGRGAIGIGITYQRGENPALLLKRVESTSLGLKIKL